jgi:hypothetical protein
MTPAIRMRAAAVLISILFIAVALARPPQKEVTVWALTDTKVYHCPGSKWYKVGNGKEMSECQAIHEGYKPALVSCGSDCR